jgi:CRISPR-associated Csx2 family protein
MARKVFLSVLGTNHYLEAVYDFTCKDGTSQYQTRFVQEATIRHFCTNWSENDLLIFFLTDAARKLNWNNPAQSESSFGEYEGLQSIIARIGLKAKVETVSIPEGYSEKEIWNIFEKVFQNFQSEDSLYFDITHAFRSIPMLIMVLINYCKFLQNISVESISYGAFEKLGPASFVKNMPASERIAPVVELKAFSDLQDWTNAANNLLNFGNATMLTSLTQSEINPILSATRGTDESSSLIRDIVSPLESFFENVRMCKIPEIIGPNNKLRKAKESLLNMERMNIPQLYPIIEKIKPLVTMLDENGNVANGIQAVKWCIEYGWYQQGYTILQETLTSIVLDNANETLFNEEKRTCVNAAFTIFKNKISIDKWNEVALKNETFINTILKNKHIVSLNEEFAELSNLRNFINHGFMKSSSCENKTIKNKLVEICSRAEQKIFSSC